MRRVCNYSNKHMIFDIIKWLILVLLFSLTTEACYTLQECYTPQNFKGNYYSPEQYEILTDSEKANCEGSCVDNNETLICCTFNDQPEKYRLLYQSCVDDHRTRPGDVTTLGVQADPSLPQAAVAHGEVAKSNEFPFMAALGWRITEKDGTESIAYRCGGTMIGIRYILTAAHCFYHSSEDPVVVRPGGFDLNSIEAVDYDIDQIIEHADYIYPEVYNDIAIVRISRRYFSKMPIITACMWYSPLADEQVTAIGYGDTQFAGNPSPLLMKANLTTISNEECNQHYEQDDEVLTSGVVATQLCAKDDEKMRDTCQGDSGGPLIVYKELPGYSRMAFVVGITSFGIGCGTGTPGIYTRISEYFDWIEDVIYK